jgi:hypothetical protein
MWRPARREMADGKEYRAYRDFSRRQRTAAPRISATGSSVAAGYGYAQTRSDDLLAHPDAITLGPIGAHTADQAEACTYAAVDWARARAATARIAVTGPHPALGRLLAAGFRIGEVETFCSTDDAAFVDVKRYVSSGGDLF